MDKYILRTVLMKTQRTGFLCKSFGNFNKKSAAALEWERQRQVLVEKLKCILLLWKQNGINYVNYAIAGEKVCKHNVGSRRIAIAFHLWATGKGHKGIASSHHRH